ncbi:MAG: hypothetical protein KDC54_12125 [Lewinella sp.]|nr:hypothetical protein [Lewinella sp.]
MTDYDPGRFTDVSDTPIGKKLWAFLNKPETVASLEVASDLGKPAVCGIENTLLEEFAEDILEDRIKQLTGHMIKQIMESRGYVVDQNNVSIRSVPFTKGTRYKKPEWQRLYVFKNTANARDICVTDTRQHGTLPRLNGGAEWRYASTFATKLQASIGFQLKINDALKGISKDGYFRHQFDRMMRAGRN